MIPPHIEVASDTEAMRMALQEYIVRLMFEGGPGAAFKASKLLGEATAAAFQEYLDSKIIKKSEVPF